MDIHDHVEYEHVEAQECKVDNYENIPLVICRSRDRGASSHNDQLDDTIGHEKKQNPQLDDIIKDTNLDDIENDDPNTFGNNIDDLQSNFINDEDDADANEDDYNTILVGWSSNNNIK